MGDIVVLPWGGAAWGAIGCWSSTSPAGYDTAKWRSCARPATRCWFGVGSPKGELVCVSPLDTVTSGMAVRVLDGDSRLTRATTGDTRTLPGADLSAPAAAGTNRASEAATPTAGDFDIDPTLSRGGADRRDPSSTRDSAEPADRVAGARGARRVAGSTRVGTAARGRCRSRRLGRSPRRRRRRAWTGWGWRTRRPEQPERTAWGVPDEAVREHGGQGRADRLAATRAAPSATPHAEPDTAASPAAPTAELDDAARRVAGRRRTGPCAARRPWAPTRSRGVLPFANVSRNPADDRLGGDMADAMAGGLRQLDGVSTVMLDAEDEVAALDAATARNAAWLISGGYQHVGGRLRITARLLGRCHRRAHANGQGRRHTRRAARSADRGRFHVAHRLEAGGSGQRRAYPTECRTPRRQEDDPHDRLVRTQLGRRQPAAGGLSSSAA